MPSNIGALFSLAGFTAGWLTQSTSTHAHTHVAHHRPWQGHSPSGGSYLFIDILKICGFAYLAAQRVFQRAFGRGRQFRLGPSKRGFIHACPTVIRRGTDQGGA